MSNGVFNFNFLARSLSEILGGSQIYTRGPYAPWTPPSREIFVPKANISQYLIVFLFQHSSFSSFRDFRGSQIYVRGPVPPCKLPSGKFFCTRGEYVTLSNGIFNLNFLALLISEILGVPNLH